MMSLKTIFVTRAERGRSLAAVLRAHLGLSWPAARQLVRAQQVRVDGVICVDPTRKLRPGQRLEVQWPNSGPRALPARQHRLPPGVPPPRLCYWDEHLLVVDKPAGLTTLRHPYEAAEFGARAQRFLPPTLADILPELFAQRMGRRPPRLWAVHRLDKDTSGLLVFALSAAAAQELGRQLRAHEMERVYLALVRGRPPVGRIESYLVRDRGDGRRGSGSPAQGKRAVTHVRLVEELGDLALVECRLETGRTHQVRIHLGEAGAPLCGERLYDRPLHGRPLPDPSGARRPLLHAAHLGLRHPVTGRWLSWTSPLPADMMEILQRWRKQSPQDTYK